MTDINDNAVSPDDQDQTPEGAEPQATPYTGRAEDRDPDASMKDVLAAVESERLSMRAGLGRGRGQPPGDGIETTWGRAYSATDELPRPMLRRMLHAPEQFLAQMLSSAERESRAVRSGISIRDVGTVRQVGDGVASVWGLPQATTDELLLFPGNINGLVMNLEANWIDCILLGSDETIQGGDVVWPTGQRITVPVGDRLLGRVVTALGHPIDGRGRIFIDERRFIEREAPGVVERQAVNEPLDTGIKAIDAIVPIGRGQRELIIGDRQTGKTTIALDTIINQRDKDVICVYVSIGQRKSTTLQVIRTLTDAGAMEHTVVVMAGPDEPPAMLYLAPYVGCTIAESFLDHGRDVLIVYDDLTKHADAYRELSLLLRRPPGREAYPGDIFYLHARLLERAGRLSDARGGGSITALPIVETRRGNITAYVPTNLISITDGQIYLSPELFNQNIKPAIEAGLSVSRVGGAAQTPIMRRVSGQLKLMLAQYEEVAHFARFGAEIDRATRQQITRGLRLREVLKQPAYSPLSLSQQVLMLYAVGEGYLDEVELDQIARFEQELWVFAQREYPSVVRRIAVDQEMDDDLSSDMEQLLQEFTRGFVT
jgi:F-type H+/Na+-transporting ATPase subunit alpha